MRAVVQHKSVLIVGIGNPDCGDDGIGPLVASRLSHCAIDGVRIIAKFGDVLALMNEWKGVDAVVLIDAVAEISQLGRIHRVDATLGEIPRELSLSSTHAFGVAEVIELARALDQLPAHVIVYAIEGESFERGAIMTAKIAAKAGEVSACIRSELKMLRQVG